GKRSYEDLFSIPIEEKISLLNQQIAYARENSSFYSYLPEKPLESLEDLKMIPTISCADLLESLDEMTCTPPWKIKRMVTLMTSGSTAAPKRLAFSERDLEGTVEFFHHGMHCLCETGESVGIFMPGSNPDGLSDLLSRAVLRFGAKPCVYGIIRDFEDAIRFCRERQLAVLVGFPVQIRQLALMMPDFRPRCVLLSADYCAKSAIATIEKYWECRAFVHYGITESGLGCAVETPLEEGMIPRSDVLLEVSDEGELLLTTLKREALPLIRYRTGDLAEIREDGNLVRVFGRIDERNGRVSITQLDEILLGFDEILNYEAVLCGSKLMVRILVREDVDTGVLDREEGECEESRVSEGVTCKESLIREKVAYEESLMREVQEKFLGELRMEELAVMVETVDEIAFTGKRFVR
ncbi:MAG: hypothetical protein MJ117_09080, partial [Lachnospiraceae bacterium]|nr:hypothetical protein [Lachnospiraceae bacterium]